MAMRSRPSMRGSFWWLLALLPLSAGQSCSTLSSTTLRPSDCETLVGANVMVAEVFELVNEERIAHGLAPVTWNETLAVMADDYCCEMIEFGYFAHANPFIDPPSAQEQLRMRAENAGYTSYWAVGENLAQGQTTPEQVMRDWMNSPGHRDNILDPRWCELGIGLRRAGGGGLLHWVQEFGQPRGCN